MLHAFASAQHLCVQRPSCLTRPGTKLHHLQLCHQCTGEAKQLHKAMELLAEMQLKVNPNAITYITTVSAGEKARQPHGVMELLAERQQKGLVLNAITCNAASVHS